MSNGNTKRRPAGLRVLTRRFGSEFGRGYHAAKLSLYDATAKHFKLLCDRYGYAAAGDYFQAGLTLAECDALHVVRQQRELTDLAAGHERRIAALVDQHLQATECLRAEHEAQSTALIAELQTWLDTKLPPRPRTLRERIAAAFDCLFNR